MNPSRDLRQPHTDSPSESQRATARFASTARLVAVAVGLIGLIAATPARAVDGCQVLLCLAAPSWRSISQCVPPVTELLRDLARGRAFPTCAMAGTGNGSSHAWSSAPTFCPPQYTRVHEGRNGPIYTCDFIGAVSVMVRGELFATTWWSEAGDTATDFSAYAKSQLGTWDNRFDRDYAAWVATQPAPGGNN